jgi:hypothetical protein
MKNPLLYAVQNVGQILISSLVHDRSGSVSSIPYWHFWFKIVEEHVSLSSLP